MLYTQFKSPGVKILCVVYLHYNVAFWAHLNDMEIPETKRFFSENVWIKYNFELAE